MANQKARTKGTGKAGRKARRAEDKVTAEAVRRAGLYKAIIARGDDIQDLTFEDEGDVPTELVGEWYHKPETRQSLEVIRIARGRVELRAGEGQPLVDISFDELVTGWRRSAGCRQCSKPTANSDGFCSDSCEDAYDEAFGV